MVRINVWSSPRNLSTALMYSWRQRSDTTVVDEPLYAHYLATTQRSHPGFDEVLASQNNRGDQVVDEVILGHYATPVVFFKQMAKHLAGLDRSFLSQCQNVLLTREPVDMLTSFQKEVPDVRLEDTGFVELVEILEWQLATGQTPIVVDSKQLRIDPEGVLNALCRRLDLNFDPAMLAWPAGPKPEDGVWAEYWYAGVHASEGFQPWHPKPDTLTPAIKAVLAAVMPLYQRLAPYSIRAET